MPATAETRDELLTLALEEYKALRSEVVNGMDRQYTLANWGVSATAVLVAALTNAWDRLQPHPYFLTFIVLVAVPGIATIYVLNWVSLIGGIARLGARLYEIEENVGRRFAASDVRAAFDLQPSPQLNTFKYLLGWEHKLRRPGPPRGILTTIRTVTATLGLLYCGLIAMGVLIFGRLAHPSSVVLILAFVSATMFWASVWLLVTRHVKATAVI